MIATAQNFKHWMKTSQHPSASKLYAVLKQFRLLQLPAPKALFGPILIAHKSVVSLIVVLARLLYWTPMFRASVKRCGSSLYLYGGFPYVTGPLQITVGDHCRISGKTTFSGRSVTQPDPQLKIGNNVDIGWMCTIAVGTRVVIGDNTRIAGQVFIAGYPGHPVDARARARGEADHDEQADDVILGEDCWIATGVTILPGVTIGARSIVATGSVVTKDIPDDVLAAGNPATVIKSICKKALS